jgi:hypothetical protein
VTADASSRAYGAQAAPADALAFATVADNRRIWDGARRGHYEVWYLTGNHLASQTGFWIRYTIEAPLHGEPYAQLWFALSDHADPSRNLALNRRFPIAQHAATAEPFSVRIGGDSPTTAPRLTHASAVGVISGAGHSVAWDLRWLPAAQTYRQLPSLVYKTGFGDTKVLTPNLDVPVRGTITVDDRVFELDGDPFGQTHVWGKKHAHSWAWGHCNAFEGKRGAALEALTVRLKRGPLTLPPLTVLGLELDGETLRWGELRHTPFTRGRYSTGHYEFSATSPTARLVGELSCRPEDLTLATYHDPDGEPSYCANTTVGDLRLTVYRRGLLKWREAARLHAPGTAAFEVASRTPDPAVTAPHLTIADRPSI